MAIAVETRTERVSGRRPRRRSRSLAGLAFVAPFLLVFAFVLIIPIGYSIYLSFFKDKLIGGMSFVGLDNYRQLFGDPKFYGGLTRVALFLVIQVPIMLGLALIAALAIDSGRLRGASFFRVSIFVPYAVPGVVAVLMWGFMYGDQIGLAGNINELLGADVLAPLSPRFILLSIGNIVTWEFVGYNMLIFYSALRTVPTSIYEAATIDGAGAWRVIRSIKLPALRQSLVIATIFSIIGSFQLFNEPNILRTLIPAVISTYYTPNMYAYNLSFVGQQYSYAATLAIVMGLVTALIAYLVQLRGSRAENR